MKQSRRMSMIEALTNVAVGYGIAVATQIVVLPMFGVTMPLADNLVVGAIFTLVSIARSYVLRRAFEAIRVRRFNIVTNIYSKMTVREATISFLKENCFAARTKEISTALINGGIKLPLSKNKHQSISCILHARTKKEKDIIKVGMGKFALKQ